MIGPLRARVTLQDAKLAAKLFNDATDPQLRRVYWIATITLLRAVSHVLDKVDSNQDPIVTASVRELWAAVSKIERDRHAIFWDFIEPERNATLKTYRLGYDDSDVASVVAPDFLPYREPNLSVMPERTSAYDGADVRELIREAIEWWEYQLGRLDQLISDRWQRARLERRASDED